MLKVIVIGCPGAGKSTFSRKLRDVTKLPLYYLDMIWHKSDQTNVSREEFDVSLDEIIRSDQWIIDGNYLTSLERRLQACDTIFLLDYSLDVCLSGVEARIGKEREDMPWIETQFDAEFKQWIIDFSKDQRPKIYELLKKYQAGRDIIIFKTRDEATTFINKLFNKGISNEI